jgi:hypothetical protein
LNRRRKIWFFIYKHLPPPPPVIFVLRSLVCFICKPQLSNPRAFIRRTVTSCSVSLRRTFIVIRNVTAWLAVFLCVLEEHDFEFHCSLKYLAPFLACPHDRCKFTIGYSKVCQFVSGIFCDTVSISEVIHFASADRRKTYSEKQRVVVTVVRFKISTFV